MKIEIEGIMRFLRSQRDGAEQCICCKGPHVFGRYVEIEARPSIYPGLTVQSLPEAVAEAVAQMPEGARVRVTIETTE